ncbi:MAG: hypothetical protein UW41_C0036G0001, partial [Candidatus Collierbacteria bacterium GW2011_GWC2_44_18]
LTKPLPALRYVTFQKVNLFMLVFEMWPATLPLINNPTAEPVGYEEPAWASLN